MSGGEGGKAEGGAQGDQAVVSELGGGVHTGLNFQMLVRLENAVVVNTFDFLRVCRS